MRSVRLALLGLSLGLLAACGGAEPTGPDAPSQSEKSQGCGYLGSAGCPALPTSLGK